MPSNSASAERFTCPVCRRQFEGPEALCPVDGSVMMPVGVPQKLIGQKIGDSYKVLSLLGEGGTALVYKAQHELMDRIVAIKVLKTSYSKGEQERLQKRFQLEAKAASSLNHPALNTLFDFGVMPDGQAYLVMDLLEGETLSAVIAQDERIPYERLIRIMVQVCDGLLHAHTKGIVHRDLKPSNIVLSPTSENPDGVKVVDFGIAKVLPGSGIEAMQLTQAGQIFGSPLYMSPEQCLNATIDARSDIYSLGMTIYYCLTGQHPFASDSLVDVISQQISDMPPPPSQLVPDLVIPKELDEILLKAVSKVPVARYQTMAELRKALNSVIVSQDTMVIKRPVLKIGTLIAGSDKARLEEIKDALSHVEDIKVLADAKSGDEALDKLSQLMPQVILIDMAMDGAGALAITSEIKKTMASARVVLFTSSDDPRASVNALAAGADAYILLSSARERLGPAIKAVMHGASWIDPAVTSRLLQSSVQAMGGGADLKASGIRRLNLPLPGLLPGATPVSAMRAAKAQAQEGAADVSVKPGLSNEKLDHAAFLEAMADMYEQENKFDEAEALWHGAIAVMEKSHGRDAQDLSGLLTRLGDLYMSRQKCQAAEKLYLRALEIRARILGDDHPEVASSLARLGELFYALGSHIDAERFLRWALRIWTKSGDEEKPHIAKAYSMLALVCRARNKSQEAEELEERAKKIRFKVIKTAKAT